MYTKLKNSDLVWYSLLIPKTRKRAKMRAGEILKQYRKIRGFTQVEVASIYGVSTSTYLNWEKSRTKIAFDDFVYLFDGVFKINQQELFDEIIPQFKKLNG